MGDLSKVLLIAKRELTTRFKQRAYRVTFVIQLLLAVLGGLAPIAIAKFVDAGGTQVVIADVAESGIGGRLADILANDGTGAGDVTVSDKAYTEDDARAAVKDGDVPVALIVTGDPADPRYEIVTSGGMSSQSSVMAMRVQAAAQTFSVEQRAIAGGASKADAHSLLDMSGVQVENPKGEIGSTASTPFADTGTAEYGVAYAGVMLVYMAIVMMGSWIAQGVVEEKSSRIMEIIVNAASPRELLSGKILGILGAGMCLLVPMMTIAGTLFALQPRIADALGVDLTNQFNIDFAGVSVRFVLLFLAYFTFGFLLFGALYAGIASMLSRQEEVGQAISPVVMLVMLGFFSGFFALAAPKIFVARILNYVPLTSPFVGIPRALLGDAPVLESVVSVAILAVTAILALLLAARIYRVGVLMYGQRPSWKSLFRLTRMQSVAR